MVGQRPLEAFILVRVQVPQHEAKRSDGFASMSRKLGLEKPERPNFLEDAVVLENGSTPVVRGPVEYDGERGSA
jgi:hypothetical protein